MIAAVAERGYHETTISHISAAAGVSRRTFYAYFSTKEECYLSTFDLIAAYLLSAGRAVAREESEWSSKVHRRIQSSLGVFAANPDLARFVLVSPLRAGETPLERYDRALAQAVAELTDGIPASLNQPPTVVQQSVLAGILGLVVQELEADGREPLESLAPDLAQIFLAAF